MAKSKNILSIVFLIIVYILGALLLFGLVNFIFSFMKNGMQNFYIQYGSDTIVNEKKGMEFEKNTVYVFYCKTATGQTVDYDIHINVNVNNFDDFDFAVDGNRKDFKAEFASFDCTELFGVFKTETYFFVCVPPDLTLQTIIQSKYLNSTVTNIPDCDLTKSDSYILTVVDSVENTTTKIYFC